MTDTVKPASAQVVNELLAREAVTPEALNTVIKRKHDPSLSDPALIQASIAATLALLDEQKRTNRLLIAAQKDAGSAIHIVRRVESDMDANSVALHAATTGHTSVEDTAANYDQRGHEPTLMDRHRAVDVGHGHIDTTRSHYEHEVTS
jgi:hypothetical protein